MRLFIRGPLPLGILGFFFAALFITLTANPLPAYEALPADSIISPLKDAVYNQLEQELDILDLHRQTLSLIGEKIPDGPDRLRAEALTHYYLGRYYQAIKTTEEMIRYAADLRDGRFLALRKYYTDREKAMAAYRDAGAAAERFLEEEPNAEAHRLYGEILGQMLILGDIGDLFSIGGKARRHVEDALKVNSTHTKALIQEASRLAYSPSAYGGDTEKARELYRTALRTGGADTEDLFNIYGGFGMAAFMEGADEEALAWFKEASSLYPGNVFAAGMTEFLEQSAESNS